MKSHNSHSSADGFGEVPIRLFRLFPQQEYSFPIIERWVCTSPMGNIAVPHTQKGEKPGPSLILRPSPFFVLQFAFSIILGGGRAAKNRLGLGTLIM